MLVIGVAGKELIAQERDWLLHPQCAGVILFTRNFASREQVMELTQSIREASNRPQLLCVDQEGGPVQRFREGFFRLPPLVRFGEQYQVNQAAALKLAQEHAWLMASEIRALGLDLSFAPVVDLGRGNRAIGDRAFHASPEIVAAFTKAYVAGMHEAGMAATLKHFPGHGSVLEDTHFDAAIDPRSLETMQQEDLLPFVAGIQAGAEAVMMGHVTYPAVAPEPAGYSARWMKDILRRDMQFNGVIFSDDIGMAAATGVGGVGARIDAHLDGGCDVVLVCAPSLVADSLKACEARPAPDLSRLAQLMGKNMHTWDGLQQQTRYHDARASLSGPDYAVS
jgi:beta-N-acetylhexosaminidase